MARIYVEETVIRSCNECGHFSISLTHCTKLSKRLIPGDPLKNSLREEAFKKLKKIRIPKRCPLKRAP
jgi:hypothetical protein